MSSFLDVTAGDLARLGPEEAVRLFRGLLWADAHIYRTRIDVPSKIDAPDGGVDATVIVPDGAHLPDGPSVIQSGLTYYQVKTEKSTSIADKAFRRRLLYGSAKRSKLSPRIKECFDAGGTMVFVLFGSDTPSRSDAEALLRQELPAGPHYADAKIEVWRQNELIWHLGRHPALRRMAKGSGHAEYLDHDGWGKNKDMGGRFVRGGQHDAFIGDIRRELCSAAATTGDKHVDVRLAGPPGSGKTRLAHEITRARDLAPFVLYFENPAPLEDNRILNALVEGEQEHAILVVDECDASEQERIGNRIYGAGGRIRLVTIYNKKDDTDAHDIPALGDAEIKKIIQGYDAPVGAAAVDMLASLCTPSPRYAHRLAERMRSDPDGFFRRPLDPEWLHKNYIAGSLDIESKEYKDREAVLSWFGLFEMVGHDPPYAAESGFLAQNVERHMGIAPGMFDRIIDDLRGLKILQGYRTLYVAPEMLHLWLWNEWWKVYGARFDLATLLHGKGTASGNPMPPRLLDWFAQMLASASALPEAKRIAGKMLSADGPLGGDGGMLENLYGAKIFHSSAMADPEAALALLSATVGTWDDARLAAFREGRREVMWAMETIALRSKDIGAVAGVLLRLAANENEAYANNATGVFTGLFSPAQGDLASTAVDIDERLALLEGALGDQDRRVRLLALEACDRALESVHLTRIDHERERILSSMDWTPGRREIAAYKRVLGMMLGRTVSMEAAEREKAAGIVLKRATQLSRLGGMPGPVAGAIRFLHDNRMADEKKLLAAVVTITSVALGGMSKRDAAAWRSLEARMSGGDYRSRMRRYVGMKIAFDHSPAKSGSGNTSRADEQVRLLAAETLRDPESFEGEAAWVLGPRAENSLAFAVELGRQDERHCMLPRLLRAASAVGGDRPAVVLGGYLSHVFERDKSEWESALDAMAGDPRLAPYVPEATWRSGLSDRAWDRIAALYRGGAVEKPAVAIFANTNRACMLSDRAFEEAVGIMLDSASAEDVGRALALLAGRCRCDGPRRGIPLDVARSVVTDARILSGAGARSGATAPGFGLGAVAMRLIEDDPEGAQVLAGAGGGTAASEFDWGAVAARIIDDDPEGVPALAGACLDAMGSRAGVIGGQGGEAMRILDRMASIAPGRVWEEAARRIVVPLDARSSHILQWAGGLLLRPGAAGPALLDTAPLEAVWGWIDADRGPRSECIARHVPRAVARGSRCIARDILARYGSDRRVRAAMLADFLSGCSFGSRGDHFSGMKKCYEKIAEEDDPRVSMWLDELIRELQEQAERGRAGDERDE